MRTRAKRYLLFERSTRLRVQEMRGALFHMYIDSEILRIKFHALKREVRKRERNFMPPYQFTIDQLLNEFEEIITEVEEASKIKCHGDLYDLKKN